MTQSNDIKISGFGYPVGQQYNLFDAVAKISATARRAGALRIYYSAAKKTIYLRRNVDVNNRYKLPDNQFLGVYDGFCVDCLAEDLLHVKQKGVKNAVN